MKNQIIRFILLSFILMFSASGIFSQEADTGAVTEAPAAAPSHLILAISSENYPVTPGDTYTLRFTTPRQEIISTDLLVENNYTINTDIIDKLNTSGVSFPQLKAVIEKKITDAYPNSRPSLTISSLGYFQVPIRGEVPRAQTVVAWGLSRLGKVLENILGPYSSIRDIMVRSRDGTIKTYDLLGARLLNDGTGDPLLRPGDTIFVSRVERTVEFRGEVFKTGIYQLIEGEGLQEAELFFGGYTPVADITRVKVDRSTGAEPVSIYLSLTEVEGNFELEYGDVVTVPPKSRNQSIVYIEGATTAPQTTETGVAPAPQSGRISVPINTGERLYDILYSRRDRFHPLADLRNAYIRRDPTNQNINIDIEKLLYNYHKEDDLVLEPLDRIIIPLKDRFVTVTGAVVRPGRFNYSVPEVRYYIDLASGFSTEADLSRIKIDRSPETVYIDLSQAQVDFEVRYGDTITVPAVIRNRPIIYIEGGIITGAPAAAGETAQGEGSGEQAETITPVAENTRMVLPINIGERLYDVLNPVRGRFHPYADLKNSYVARGENGDIIEVDLETLLYKYDKALDIIVEPFDRIIIPLKERFVTLSGAVNRPGRYYYAVPNVNYYIGIAGGINPERNTNNEFIVLDSEGKPKDPTSLIQPGDTIDVVTNSFFYYFNRYVPLITTGVALITSAITLIEIFSN